MFPTQHATAVAPADPPGPYNLASLQRYLLRLALPEMALSIALERSTPHDKRNHCAPKKCIVFGKGCRADPEGSIMFKV
jgi:hypothetical protein